MLETAAKCLSRPFRAFMAALPACFMPLVMFVASAFFGGVIWFYMLMPAMDIDRTWTPASCTIAGELTLGRVRKKGEDGWRVDLPVTFRQVDAVGAPEVSATAHRWPNKIISDNSKAALFDWWTLDFGGGGKVLEAPATGWFGSKGKFEFTTTIGKVVPCWYLPTRGAGPPTQVKLSDEPVAAWGYWAIGGALALLVVATVGLGCYLCGAAVEDFGNSYERLEEGDSRPPPALRRINSRAGKLVGARAIQRSTSHFDLKPSDYYLGSHTVPIRNGFLRKVYGIVCCQALLTVGVSVLFMYYEPMAEWVMQPCVMLYLDGPRVFCSAWLVWGTYLSMFASLFFCHVYKNEYPANYLMLSFFTLTVSFVVGITCSMYRTEGYADLILQALVMTASLFVALTLFTLQSSIDFSFMATGLFCALVMLPVAGLLSFLLQSAILYTLYAYSGSLVFCFYIVFDTHMSTYSRIPPRTSPARECRGLRWYAVRSCAAQSPNVWATTTTSPRLSSSTWTSSISSSTC